MGSNGDLIRENETWRRRVCALSAANLRVSASLELDTVLREVVESARALTGTRYGAIVTVDDSGQPLDFVTSGLSDEERRRLMERPGGPRLFAHLLPGVLGGPEDAPACLRPPCLCTDLLTFRDTALRHQGVHLGNLYLVGKVDGEGFTGADEEVLELFAAHAAGAVANARSYRAERLARAGLEALVDSSPVGVAVFDAETGSLVSLNREAGRLLESLYRPGSSPDQLLKVISCRRADGRHGALEQLPVSAEVVKGERLLTEELTLCGPDGRSTRALVNAATIHAGEDTPASVVVTLQDLAPIQELQRMQVDFLDTVSRALRAPLTSIKGSTATVLCASPVPAAAEMLRFLGMVDEQADHMSDLLTGLLDAAHIDTGMLALTPEPSEAGALVEQAHSTFLSSGARHTVLIDLAPDLPPVAADRGRIVQVLGSLLSAAARHAPESAPIRVSAVRDGVYVAISVSDTGAGVAPGRLAQSFRKYSGGRNPGPGGSGSGLAVCKGLVEAHGGRLRAERGRPDPGRPGYVHAAVGRSGRRYGRSCPQPAGSACAGARAGAHPGGGPRPAGAAPCARGTHQCRLRGAGHRRPCRTGAHDRHRKPALVLLDLVLSETGGSGLAQRIPALADLPVIFSPGAAGTRPSPGRWKTAAPTISPSRSRRRNWWRASARPCASAPGQTPSRWGS